MTSAEIDLRVGGRWRYVMVANEGFEVAFHGEFREIAPDERLVNTEVYEMPGADPLPPEDEPVNTITFTETDGRTTLSCLMQCPNKELRDMIIESGHGGRHAGVDGPARGGRGLAALSGGRATAALR